MSFFNFSRHIAIFLDDNGDQVGKKIFKRSWSDSIGIDKKTFSFNGGSYNIDPLKACRLKLSFKTAIFFDNYIYIYKINNPDPISFKGGFAPVMDPLAYEIRLKTNLIDALNRAGRGKLNINWKYIIIGIVVLIVLYLAFSGNLGALFGGGAGEVVNNITNISSSRL